MNLIDILDYATDKTRFTSLEGFTFFCENYLEYIDKNLQAIIISQNENHYRFFQYNNWGSFQITRPVNSNLFYSIADFDKKKKLFSQSLKDAKSITLKDAEARDAINKVVYTVQQSIGAALDALPPGESNKARKINGSLFENFVRLIIREIGIECKTGVVNVPVIVDGIKLFNMSYQHDLIVKMGDDLKMLGAIKTSSKDRLDKMFIDKFLYSRLTETQIPHIAIILNDVQRKQTKKVNKYGINSTFLPGHFKGYTVKLNALDGVYYCDIRPNMLEEEILKNHIKTLDYLLCDDIWKFV
jgi:hypothetical protein